VPDLNDSLRMLQDTIQVPGEWRLRAGRTNFAAVTTRTGIEKTTEPFDRALFEKGFGNFP
jgi:hypothetical protein